MGVDSLGSAQVRTELLLPSGFATQDALKAVSRLSTEGYKLQVTKLQVTKPSRLDLFDIDSTSTRVDSTRLD